MPKTVSLEEAMKTIKSNDKIYIHGVSCTPQILIDGLVARKNELSNVEIMHLHTESNAKYILPEYKNSFYCKSFFVGANVRKAVQEHRADYIPIFLSEVPLLFRNNIIKLDIALIQISPPDNHGYCSLGVSVEATLAAIESANIVIAQINKKMPQTIGDSCISISHIDYFVEHESEIPQALVGKITPEEQKIGENIAELVENGATLQLGIGSIPNAALNALQNHKRLGIHTEMFSDGIIPLVEKGVITGEEKILNKEKIVSSFIMGSKKLYDFVDNNPGILLMDCAYVNDTAMIRKNPKVISINSAIEIDYTGQVCADSIGAVQFSGVGGQMDFIRGASYSKGGKPIIAMTAATKKGVSKIVSTLKNGAGVVTTRANIHYVVTEYGTVNLFGKSLKERAKLMISIAHPNNRNELEEEYSKRFC